MPVSQRKKQRSVFYSGPAELYPEFRSNDGDTEKEPGGENARMQELQMEFNPQEKAAVIVKGEVYPGTTIIIGDSSMQVKNTYQYCRFERIDGDVKATAI